MKYVDIRISLLIKGKMIHFISLNKVFGKYTHCSHPVEVLKFSKQQS